MLQTLKPDRRPVEPWQRHHCKLRQDRYNYGWSLAGHQMYIRSQQIGLKKAYRRDLYNKT